MANVGGIKTLVTTLRANALLSGVTVSCGDENVYPESFPAVNVSPGRGPWTACGYAQGVDNDINAIWTTTESLKVVIWAADSVNVDPESQYEAVEALRAKVLQALQAQTDSGLKWAPVSGNWVAPAEVGQLGRAYALDCVADISVTDVAPQDATVTTVTQNVSITH